METIGSLIDKLSINELKIYHMNEQLERTDVDQEFKDNVSSRLDILLIQKKDLKEELQSFMDDVLAGRKKMKMYRQMKMYNDSKYKK